MCMAVLYFLCTNLHRVITEFIPLPWYYDNVCPQCYSRIFANPVSMPLCTAYTNKFFLISSINSFTEAFMAHIFADLPFLADHCNAKYGKRHNMSSVCL